MANELSCTCGDGGQASDNKQEIIEKRLAPMHGLTVTEVHGLLDLLVDVLDEVLDLDDGEADEVERRMAQRSGRPLDWIERFVADWEAIGDELDGTEWWKLPESSASASDCS